jgi:peptidylprolyl isomerase
MKRSEKEKGKAAAAQKKKIYTIVAVAVAAMLLFAGGYFAYTLITPTTARAGDTVAIYYTGSLDDGSVFDTNAGGDPLKFVLGKGSVIPGMEEAVLGMAVNESKIVHIPPEKAYGQYRPNLIKTLDNSAIPANMTILPGDHITVRRTADGAVSRVRIVNITSSGIIVDENHDLAGKNLTFEIRIAGISRN